jgi:hypothetical protein
MCRLRGGEEGGRGGGQILQRARVKGGEKGGITTISHLPTTITTTTIISTTPTDL